VRVLNRIHRADFETNPFDPLAPYDLTQFVSAGLFDLVPQPPVLGTAPTPTPVDPEEPRVVGPAVTGAAFIDLVEMNMTIEEFMAQLSANAVPFPEYFIDDPVIADATRWFLFDVTVYGATPGFNMNVFWYSIPTEVARAEVGQDGTVSFQAAVPESMITTGESDTLRLVAVFPAGTAIADPNGFIAQDVELSDEILYFAEKGSFASILFTGIAGDGSPKEGSVDVLIDALMRDASPDRSWLVWSLAALLLLLLLLLLLWLLRRREDEDEDELDELADGEGAPGGPASVPPPPAPNTEPTSSVPPPPVAGMTGSGTTPPPPPPSR
jgi:hypothetical protein